MNWDIIFAGFIAGVVNASGNAFSEFWIKPHLKGIKSRQDKFISDFKGKVVKR